MQPTYLPWAGYFGLLDYVDVFVFLDDVQFQKSSWQTRNRILFNGQEHLLTVPTRNMSLSTLISDVEIDHRKPWKKKHWKTLTAAYKNAPYAKEVLDLLEPVYSQNIDLNLSELNISIITRIQNFLGINTETVLASEIGCGGTRSDHIIEICNSLGCTKYVSPPSAKDYLSEDQFEMRGDVELSFYSYLPQEYRQLKTDDFVSHLSIVDVIANLGLNESKHYIAS